MNSIEEILRLKESVLEYQGKIPETEKKVIELSRLQLELDEGALKAEILEERGWQKKKEKAEENRAKISELKAEMHIADDSGRAFRRKPATHSDAKRPPIPM